MKLPRIAALSLLRRRLAAALALAPALVMGPAAAPAVAAPDQQAAPPPAYRYQLVDTWEKEPWALRAGHYGRIADVSSAPDGTIYVLDDRHQALHALAPDGTPLRVMPVPDLSGPNNPEQIGWTLKRLDVGFDGNPYVLSDGLYLDKVTNQIRFKARIDKLSPNGEALARFVFEPESFSSPHEGRYLDIALRDDGRIYLARSAVAMILFFSCEPQPGDVSIRDAGVDVLDPQGNYIETIDFASHGSIPTGLDLDLDGVLHVINAIPSALTNPYCGPQPTEEPSRRGPEPERLGAGASAAPAQAITPTPSAPPWDNGVAIFEPNHRLREIVPFFNAEDIAVGPAGIFVSRNVEIFQLRDDKEPLWVGPIGRVYAAYFDNHPVIHLDVPTNGKVVASFQHCYWQGAMIFDRPQARPDTPSFHGMTDVPELEGPAYPARIAAGEDLAVLLGRYQSFGQGAARQYQGTNQLVLPQTIQRWTRHGQVQPPTSPLSSQTGMCAGGRTWYTRDVAMDGKAVYSMDFGQIQRRPDHFLPEWGAWPQLDESPEEPFLLSAVSADSGRVAAFDKVRGKVFVLDDTGKPVSSWTVDGGGNSVPVDLAIRGDRVFLADRGANRVLVRGIDGEDLGAWPTHDGPAAIATGPSGDVYVLGRGRWAYRYRADGRLLASWPMPDRGIWALDITVDQDEAVYVSFLHHEELPDSAQPAWISNQFQILRSGLWIFKGEPYVPEEAPPPAATACTAVPDKWAAPRRIPLGNTVDVSLTVAGRCPGRQTPVQVAVVVDTSRSMNYDSALARAKAAVGELLQGLDPRSSEVALVTFDDGATLLQPLTGELGKLSQTIAGLEALGDTRSTAGISTAHQELRGLRGKPLERQVIVMVSDGSLKDDPTADAEAALADGIELYALVLPNREFQPPFTDQLTALVGGDREHVLIDPSPMELSALVDSLTDFIPELGLFATISIVDEIPANMDYVVDSARPSAVYDPQRRTLTWSLGRRAADEPISLGFRLRPLEVGIWPTNVRADAAYRDALGNDGRLVFPIPQVEVWAPESHPGRVYLPLLLRQQCIPVDKPLDIVLVLDSSSSMRETTGGAQTKLEAARLAAQLFIDRSTLGPLRDQLALVSFNRDATLLTALTDDRAALAAGLAALQSQEGTRIDLGLQAAAAALGQSGRPEAKPVVILLTDGIQNNPERPGNADVLAAAAVVKNLGALVYTIGLGLRIDVALLREVASSPARFYPSPTAEQLADIYRQISEQLPCDLRGAIGGG
ncbi:MAG TPA: VWA domain-containing protein [Anaerolineae bacterium]|nr:VWA domain-containing protein [Anaerolineae bacterium]